MAHSRTYGCLTAASITTQFTRQTILCLPIGSYEQHGPHLPLHTDTVIAEKFSDRLIERYGDDYDIWALPTLPYGLSLEHAWSPGTISLRSNVFINLLSAVVGEYVRATPARNILIVNGHGGNRGVLEAALYELRRDHGVNSCVIHPSALSKIKVDNSLPEIHSGMRETSVMLALAPDDVHLDRIPTDYAESSTQRDLIRQFVLDRGVTWPWSSRDERISKLGIIGSDPREATLALGESTISSALDSCQEVLATLRTQQSE